MISIEKQLKNKSAKMLYGAILSMENEVELTSFLRDLLTIEELEEAIRRFEVLRLLNTGATSREIVSKTKMSSATISRINYWFNHGTGGYRIALKRLTEGSA